MKGGWARPGTGPAGLREAPHLPSVLPPHTLSPGAMPHLTPAPARLSSPHPPFYFSCGPFFTGSTCLLLPLLLSLSSARLPLAFFQCLPLPGFVGLSRTLYSPLSASQPLALSLYLCSPSQTHWGLLGRCGSDAALTLWWLFPFQIGLVVILVATVVAMSAVAQLWEDEWEVLLISLQGTAPFLHMGALVAVTALSWIVAGQFARAERSSSQMAILGTFFTVVFALYLAPLTISSPCIMEKKDLAPKPALIGHRGAPMLAPEHTLMSFRKALEQKLYGLQADVTISLDGVPFLMHDATLRRTTNVEEEFPELARRPASMLNWTLLQRLNAGQWFLKTDPFWTASSLSPSDHREAQNQSICSLTELLELAKGNATLLLNLRDPPREHPYRGSFLNVTLEALLRSGFPQHQVLWLPNRQRPFVQKVAPGFQQTSGSKEAAASLRRGHIQRLNLRYTQVSRQELRDYASWNLSVNLYTVNAPWLFSLLWCAGVPSVTSDNSHTLSQVPSPLWIMPPDEYCLMWVTADLISFILIVGIFVLQKWRLGGIRSYNPEQIMLSAAVHRTSRDVSIMKEKLIFSEISDGMEVSDEVSVCSDNSYDTYANSTTSPMGPQGSSSRATTLTDRNGR
ncbi:glycerophosphodiester phosphodiesterase domain-containing protein 5 isoform X2 [Physeter macrocephalus]|uniref:Glycerophosphodiester phosphodiesterase domain-containing protein 5 isoform X2 n=1 Tax=Physeter macrocephalus TaxID=9755 RepID=A0A9W2W657_PHYMC|nr:glycerophosphodiester phosphodiesterase domain-containing protein 5 isoform X2 [Physeter catodon]